MSGFFYICDYLQISPKEFFDMDIEQPERLRKIIENLKKLSPNLLDSISLIVEALIKK